MSENTALKMAKKFKKELNDKLSEMIDAQRFAYEEYVDMGGENSVETYEDEEGYELSVAIEEMGDLYNELNSTIHRLFGE
jgi:hypothetical protein